MTLQQLRYATAVADTGTISRAAQQFFIAQPSLTNAIRELEQEVGLTIFHRTNRGVALTPEGEEFLGYARQVLAQMELIEEKLSRLSSGQASVLRVGPTLFLCRGSLCGVAERIRRRGI